MIADNEEIQTFFVQLEKAPDESQIITAPKLLGPSQAKVLRIDLEEINDELIKHLATHPEYMRVMNPRKFEELIAELFKRKGYRVRLTPQTRDGGLDIYAIEKDDFGAGLTLIECKRWSPENKVGIDIVQRLSGVLEGEASSN